MSNRTGPVLRFYFGGGITRTGLGAVHPHIHTVPSRLTAKLTGCSS